MTIIWIWLSLNVAFVLWRSIIAAGRADIAPAELARAK